MIRKQVIRDRQPPWWHGCQRSDSAAKIVAKTRAAPSQPSLSEIKAGKPTMMTIIGPMIFAATNRCDGGTC